MKENREIANTEDRQGRSDIQNNRCLQLGKQEEGKK